jgi:anti-sigma-K factor RskA
MTTGTDEREDLLTRYALGELVGDEARAFERRLAADPELAREARELRRSFEQIGYSATREPPAALRARVLAAAASAAPPAGRGVRGVPWSIAAPLTGLAASALLALGIGARTLWVENRALRAEIERTRVVMETFHQPNVVVSFTLENTGPGASALGEAVLDLDAKRAALLVRGLPELPANQVYKLWALVGEKHVPCGTFRADARAEITRQFAIPVAEYTEPVRKLIVTIEPDDTSATPTGPTVMQSS